MAKQRPEPDVTIALRQMITAQPFRPFNIKTSEGDTYHVFHPDYCMISPTGGTALLYQRLDDGFTVVNLRHVVSMEPSRPRKGLLGSPGKK